MEERYSQKCGVHQETSQVFVVRKAPPGKEVVGEEDDDVEAEINVAHGKSLERRPNPWIAKRTDHETAYQALCIKVVNVNGSIFWHVR